MYPIHLMGKSINFLLVIVAIYLAARAIVGMFFYDQLPIPFIVTEFSLDQINEYRARVLLPGFFITLIYFILFTNSSNAKICLSFLPYGFNESYVHLPQSASFCVKQGKTKYEYQTDNYGGRLLYNGNTNNKIQVFGDSQVLGLDVDKIEQHYLNTLYKKVILFFMQHLIMVPMKL